MGKMFVGIDYEHDLYYAFTAKDKQEAGRYLVATLLTNGMKHVGNFRCKNDVKDAIETGNGDVDKALDLMYKEGSQRTFLEVVEASNDPGVDATKELKWLNSRDGLAGEIANQFESTKRLTGKSILAEAVRRV